MLPSVHRISIHAGRIVRALVVVAACLVLVSVAGQTMRFHGPYDTMLGLIRLVNVNEEANLPTFFSSFLMLFAGALVATIAACTVRARGPYARHWSVLAVLLVFMAVDETAGLHELAVEPMGRLLGQRATGILFLAWVVPGSALVLAVAVAYLRFWLQLPARTRVLSAVAAVTFFGGAIGVELFEGLYLTEYGVQDFRYQMIATVQESLEMAGMIVLISAMLGHLEALGSVQLSWQGARERLVAPVRVRASGVEAGR